MSTATHSNRRNVWVGIAVTVVVLALVATFSIRATVQGLPPGTTLAGEPVSSVEDAANTATAIAGRLEGLPVIIAVAGQEVEVTAGMLGATFDQPGVVRAAQDAVGLDGWADRLSGGGTVQLPGDLFFTTGGAGEIADRLSTPPVDGGVEITAGGIRATDPVVGVTVTTTMISQAFRDAAQELVAQDFADWPDALRVDLDADTVEPVVTQASVDAVVARIEELTTTPVELEASAVPEDSQTVDSLGVPSRETISVTLAGEDLLQLLDVEVDPQAIQRERLRVVSSTSSPPTALVTFLDRAGVAPDLAVTVEGRSPTPTKIVPEDPAALGSGGVADNPAYSDVSTVAGQLAAELVSPGLEPSLDDTIESIVAAMLAGEPTAEVRGEPITDVDPAALGIVQPISTFTTFYEPGQSRVTNIHQIAALVDGAMVPPGGNYELNHAVGRRTEAGGFVTGGAILEGEFVTDVGGGVSQFATTFFNAMWFSGVDIITHTPHSFYFDRYPAGREATIDYPGVDLELNNNTPYWILIDTAVTDESVTVTFWSTDWFDVATTMGPRQSTAEGFRMSIARVSTAQDGTVDDDMFTIDYKLS